MPINLDVAIFGGGIAGLWTLALARSRGLSAVLFEKSRLGQGQTIASQGIIHGGVKYALGGLVGDDSKRIAEMPERWRAALRGEGEVDLRAARVLSGHTYLWTTGGLGAKVMGLAASKAIRSTPERIERSEWPAALRGAPKGVDVYRVAEPVLEVASVLEALRGPDALRYQFRRFEPTPLGLEEVEVGGPDRRARVSAARVVFAAGEGNREVLDALGLHVPRIAAIRTQSRPLAMIMVRGRLPELFGHAIGSSHRPLLTITSGAESGGMRVWYVGGQIAEPESGLWKLDAAGLESRAREEMLKAMPWTSLEGVQWARSFQARAEAATADGRKPDGPVVHRVGNLAFCWPTKLAFAPLAAEELLEGLEPRWPRDERAWEGWPRAEVARYPWESEVARWT